MEMAVPTKTHVSFKDHRRKKRQDKCYKIIIFMLKSRINSSTLLIWQECFVLVNLNFYVLVLNQFHFRNKNIILHT